MHACLEINCLTLVLAYNKKGSLLKKISVFRACVLYLPILLHFAKLISIDCNGFNCTAVPCVFCKRRQVVFTVRLLSAANASITWYRWFIFLSVSNSLMFSLNTKIRLMWCKISRSSLFVHILGEHSRPGSRARWDSERVKLSALI